MIYIGLQMPVMMQMHGLFIDIRLEGIIGIGQWRVLKWIMLVHGKFLFSFNICVCGRNRRRRLEKNHCLRYHNTLRAYDRFGGVRRTE